MVSSCPVRPASLADLPALAELERGAFTDPWTEAQLAAALGWPGVLATVLESGGGLVGYVLGRVIVDQGEILSIATSIEHRREGIGQRLLDSALTAMAVRGARSVWLEVRVSNQPARSLYAAAGFTEAGFRRGYYRNPPEDALILRRELPADASL